MDKDKTIKEMESTPKITKYNCNKCNKTFICKTCDSESSIKFKHRTHCYSWQLGIDVNCKEFHTCNECFVPDEDEWTCWNTF